MAGTTLRLTPSKVPDLFKVAGTRHYQNSGGDRVSARQYDKARRGGVSNERYAKLTAPQKHTVLENSTRQIFQPRKTRLVSELLRPKRAGKLTSPTQASAVTAFSSVARGMLDAAFKSGTKPSFKTKQRMAKLTGLDVAFFDDYLDDYEWEDES